MVAAIMASRINTNLVERNHSRKYLKKKRKIIVHIQKINQGHERVQGETRWQRCIEVLLPFYGNDDRDETLLTMVKEFNMIIKDGDLFKEKEIGEEAIRDTFTRAEKSSKLRAIKETF